MRLSLSNGVFAKYSLEENFALIKKLGFENVEFNMKTVRKEHEELVYVAKKLLNYYGFNCLTLHSATHYVGDEIEIPKAIYYGKVSIEFAYRLQASTIVMHSNVLRNIPEELRIKIIKKIFHEIIPYARDRGIKIALENLTYANRGYGKNVAELDQILKIMDDDTIGVTLDVSHAMATGVVNSLLDKYHTLLYNIHLSNSAHTPFITETPQLIDFLTRLAKHHYDGPLTIELNRKCATENILKTKTTIEKILKSLK